MHQFFEAYTPDGKLHPALIFFFMAQHFVRSQQAMTMLLITVVMASIAGPPVTDHLLCRLPVVYVAVFFVSATVYDLFLRLNAFSGFEPEVAPAPASSEIAREDTNEPKNVKTDFTIDANTINEQISSFRKRLLLVQTQTQALAFKEAKRTKQVSPTERWERWKDAKLAERKRKGKMDGVVRQQHAAIGCYTGYPTLSIA